MTYNSLVKVKKRGDDAKYVARVLAIGEVSVIKAKEKIELIIVRAGHECDIALLTVRFILDSAEKRC